MLSCTDRYFPGNTGVLFGNEERLGKKPLNLPRPADGLLVVFTQLIDTQDRDDVLKVLITLEYPLYFARNGVVILSNDPRIQNP